MRTNKTRLFSVLDSPTTCSPCPSTSWSRCDLQPSILIPFSSGSSYSGIGRPPNQNSENVMNTHVVRSRTACVKEDVFATSRLWRLGWLVFKEQTLSIYKSLIYRPLKTSPPYHHPLGHGSTTSLSGTISLRDIANIEWIDLKPCCLLPRRAVPLVSQE